MQLQQFTSSWSISHDCAKFSHDHTKFSHDYAKSTWRFSFSLQHNSTFCSISHDNVKWKYLIFNLSFVISSISFSWFHFNYLQINSKSRSKPIALLLSLCIWIIINIICCLQFDSSLLSPIYQNHTLKWL